MSELDNDSMYGFALFVFGFVVVIALIFGFIFSVQKAFEQVPEPKNDRAPFIRAEQREKMRDVRARQKELMRNQRQKMRDMQRR